MALSASKTGKKIADIITDSEASAEMKAKVLQIWTDVMDAIYTDIKSDSQITVAAGIAVSTTGSSSAQSGMTTATGTATIA